MTQLISQVNLFIDELKQTPQKIFRIQKHVSGFKWMFPVEINPSGTGYEHTVGVNWMGIA